MRFRVCPRENDYIQSRAKRAKSAKSNFVKFDHTRVADFGTRGWGEGERL